MSQYLGTYYTLTQSQLLRKVWGSGSDNDLLSIVELCGILLVFELSRLHLILEPSEVVLAHLLLLVGLETLVKRRLLALVVLSVDGSTGGLGE